MGHDAAMGMSTTGITHIERVELGPSDEARKLASIYRWLIRHPVELDTLTWLAAMDTDQPDDLMASVSIEAVRRYASQTVVVYCGQCCDFILRYVDGRQIRFTSLAPHDCASKPVSQRHTAPAPAHRASPPRVEV